jgi:hypothetical protein
MKLFTGGSLDGNVGTPIDIEKAKMRVMRYHS